MDNIRTNTFYSRIRTPRLTSSDMPNISEIDYSISETSPSTSNFGYYLTIFFLFCIVGFIIGLYYFRNHPIVTTSTKYIKDTITPYTTLSSTFSEVHYQPSYATPKEDTSNEFYTINGYDPVIKNEKDSYSYPNSYTSTKDISLTPTLPTINKSMIKEPPSANKIVGSTSPSFTKQNNLVINQDTKLTPYHDDKLDTTLNNASQSLPGPSADDSHSSIQTNKSSSKSGWCFIGEDRGYRSCVEVGENDKCMSGDIFPTKDICINPTLRE